MLFAKDYKDCICSMTAVPAIVCQHDSLKEEEELTALLKGIEARFRIFRVMTEKPISEVYAIIRTSAERLSRDLVRHRGARLSHSESLDFPAHGLQSCRQLPP